MWIPYLTRYSTPVGRVGTNRPDPSLLRFFFAITHSMPYGGERFPPPYRRNDYTYFRSFWHVKNASTEPELSGWGRRRVQLRLQLYEPNGVIQALCPRSLRQPSRTHRRSSRRPGPADPLRQGSGQPDNLGYSCSRRAADMWAETPGEILVQS